MFGHDFNEFPDFFELHDQFPLKDHVGCPCSTNIYGIYCSNLIQRSITSHFESESSSVSSGDLQGMALHNQWLNSPLASENSITESMNRASRYNPEERKERIQRYRIKRNLRNFNKKIKYECRKTLADRRPRVRGRFAKNDEIEKVSQSRWDRKGVEEDDDDWINFLDILSANMMPN